MNNPLVSIIVPTYNRIHLFKDTLNSVINQTYFNWELVVVDDGSDEETLTLLEEYNSQIDRFVFFQRNREPKGVSTCRNIGIEMAKGYYIIFLDSDDILRHDCIECRLSFIKKNLSFDFWIFNVQEFKRDINNLGSIHNSYPERESNNDYLKLFLKGINSYSVLAPIYTSKLFKETDSFDEELSLWEDPELSIRLLLSNFKFKADKFSSPDSFYRTNRDTKSELLNNTIHLEKLIKNTLLYFKKNIFSLKNNNKWHSNKDYLRFNIIKFMHESILNKGEYRRFWRFYRLLLFKGMISLKINAILLIWFNCYFFNKEKIGKWHKEGLRKKLYSIIATE